MLRLLVRPDILDNGPYSPRFAFPQEFDMLGMLIQGVCVGARYRSFTLCHVWRREMDHLLARCGFEIEAWYGGGDRRPFDADSTEQVWVARRP
jgi:hypothetical protein